MVVRCNLLNPDAVFVQKDIFLIPARLQGEPNLEHNKSYRLKKISSNFPDIHFFKTVSAGISPAKER
jgi:hypothetical protein